MSTKTIPATNTVPATVPAAPNATLLANASLPLGKTGDFLTCLRAILVGLNGRVDASALLPALQTLADQTGSGSAEANTSTATTGASAPRPLPAVLLPEQSYYDWMTTHKSCSRNSFNRLFALRLAAVPDFPRSSELAVNCGKVLTMGLNADELAAFVHTWQFYEQAMRRRSSYLSMAKKMQGA